MHSRLTICGGIALDSVTIRAVSWNRSNFYWTMGPYRRRKSTSNASSGSGAAHDHLGIKPPGQSEAHSEGRF